MIKLYDERCPQDHKCPLIKMCPKDSIQQEGFNAPTIDRNKCIECKICVKNCPYNIFEEE